jgi:hypothetical protein
MCASRSSLTCAQEWSGSAAKSRNCQTVLRSGRRRGPNPFAQSEIAVRASVTTIDPYHSQEAGYYAAFVLDPDGNNIEAVFHGEAKRSAPSVKVTF